MSRANGLYNYERELAVELDSVRASSDPNRDTILRYHNQCVADGLSLARIVKKIGTVRRLSRMLAKRFEDANKEDIVRIVAQIEQKNISVWTKHDYKSTLKQFYRWLKGNEMGETPSEVRWIRSRIHAPSKLLSRNLLTPEEINRIVESADSIQEKALFAAYYDSGRRPGEILGLRVGDVEFDRLGAKLRVDGKVGVDIVRICGSAPRLALWLDNHPAKCEPSAPLWIVCRGGRLRQMTYGSMRYRLKIAAKRAGLNKRVWTYLFRHSRITPASTKLSYSEMCHVFGWKQGSDMPQFYVHLSGEDRDNAFLKMNGMPVQANGNENNGTYPPVVCPRCKRTNSPDAKYCNGCGLALDVQFALNADQRKASIREQVDRLSEELAKSPEIADILLKALTALNATGTNATNRS